MDSLYANNPAVLRGADQGDLAAEFVFLVGLAFADALDLGGLHAVELVAVIAFLVEDLRAPLQHRGQQSTRRFAFAFDVSDDPAQIVAQQLLLPFGPVPLPGMTVAPLHDEGLLAESLIGLAQIDSFSLGQLHQETAGLVVKPGIGREGDGFFLDGGIDVNPLQMPFGQVLFALCRLDRYLEQLFHSLRTDPLAPLHQGGRVEGKIVLEELEAAKVLPVAVLHELVNDCLVAHIVSVLEVVQPDEKANRQAGTTEVFGVQGAEFSVKDRPVDGVRQAIQGMLPIEDLIQPSTEQIALVTPS